TTHNHMNTNNSGDMSLNQAASQKAKIKELPCDELTAANKEARKNETKGSFTGGAHTTAYRKDVAGNGKYMKAMCPNKPKKKFSDDYQDPLPEAGTQPDCKEGKPTGGKGRSPGSGRINDAENKILNPEMAAGKGGMIKMSTLHTGKKGLDAMPCYSCRQAICEAEECGIEVWLCKATNKPPEAVRPKEKGLCPPKAGQGDYDESWAKEGLGAWP
ncbi:hypothetical protein KA005_03995, partial [bacterium]|nr:hypothetical protein [bacterium]